MSYELAAAIIAALLLLAPVAARHVTDPAVDSLERALRSPWAPAIAGVVSALALLFAWGGVDRLPAVHDERAYLLQAELFASGRWTGPGRVLPEFFEQPHVIVTPVLASKYFPGHSLALVPGVLLGAPGLVVVLLAGLTGALAFALARRVAGPWVAALTLAIWLSSYQSNDWRATYFSEATSGALYLATWWALLRWRDRPRARTLALAALFAGLCVITRPLTGVALAVPAGLWALARLARMRPARWRDAAAGVAALAATAAIIPLWSARTTGDWRITPQTQYTLDYMPYDVPGLGIRAGAARRPAPPDLADLNGGYLLWHARHVADSLPTILAERADMITRAAWYDGRPALLVASVVGLAALPAVGWLAVGTVLLHVLLYLFYAHPTFWVLYYVETFPVFAFVAALGLWRAYAWAVAAGARGDAADRLARQGVAAAVACLVFAWQGSRALARSRGEIARTHELYANVQRALDGLPGRRIVVFVRYGAGGNITTSFVHNAPLQDTSRVWTAYDRGADNARLMRVAPDRVPYLFDVSSRRLMPLAAAPPGLLRPHGYVVAPPPGPPRGAD